MRYLVIIVGAVLVNNFVPRVCHFIFRIARFEPMFTRVAWKSAIIFSNYIQNALTVDLIAAAEQLPQPYLTWLCKGGVTA